MWNYKKLFIKHIKHEWFWKAESEANKRKWGENVVMLPHLNLSVCFVYLWLPFRVFSRLRHFGSAFLSKLLIKLKAQPTSTEPKALSDMLLTWHRDKLKKASNSLSALNWPCWDEMCEHFLLLCLEPVFISELGLLVRTSKQLECNNFPVKFTVALH